MLLLPMIHPVCLAQVEQPEPVDGQDAPAEMIREGGAEASNPLASVNSIDLKWTYTELTDPNSSRSDRYWIKGSYTINRKTKLSYFSLLNSPASTFCAATR